MSGRAGIDAIGLVGAPWLAAGLAAPALVASGPLGIAVLLLAAPALLVLQREHVGSWAIGVAAAMALLGTLWSLHGMAALAADPLRARIGSLEHARVVVEGQPRPGPFGTAATARLDGHVVELRARAPLMQGAIAEVSGRLAPVPASRGGFDRRAWLARQGVHETLTARTLVVVGMRGGLDGTLDRLRRAARAALAAGGDDEASRIATGVALGGTAALDERTVDAFRASGLAHLLAVSGGNVVLLIAAVLALAWLAGLPRPLAHGCAIPAVVAYAAIVGGGPSVVRAAATGVLASLAWLAGSARDPWHLLALAAAAVLALDPWAVTGPGFQLSFAAVAAIHGLAPRIRDWLEGTVVPRCLCAAIAVSVACTAASAPIAFVHFGRTSLAAGLPANLLALPAVAPLLWLALAACVLWPVAPGATAVLDLPVRGLGAYIGMIARFGAWLDATLPAPVLLIAVAGGACAWAVVRRPSVAGAGALAGLVIALAWPVARASPPPPHDLRVTFLDVGQGDAALIEAPGVRVLVDTGPPEARVERQLRRRGIRSLDALYLSHDERDHDGRAAAIVRSLRVALLVTPAQPGGSAAFADALAAAHTRDTRVLGGRAGLVLRRGPVEVRVLGPLRATRATPANDAALVILARQGACSFLLPADAESPVLLTDRLPPVGVLEVAHHGSRDPGLGRLLTQLRPRLAVISVGAGNSYGHPAAETLAALAATGVRVLRTDREGDVPLACPSPA